MTLAQRPLNRESDEVDRMLTERIVEQQRIVEVAKKDLAFQHNEQSTLRRPGRRKGSGEGGMMGTLRGLGKKSSSRSDLRQSPQRRQLMITHEESSH